METGERLRDTPLYRYRFGSAEFDEARFELRVNGLALELERKPLEVLLELLRHAGEVVTKEELFESVWAGRITVENVLANAVAKLRKALGEAHAERIVTQPRIGYRLDGAVERVAVGRKLQSGLRLQAGHPAPGREHFILDAQLAHMRGGEVWRARHAKTGEIRVYKFSPDGERLAALKREATLSRVLRQSLGERDDFIRIIDWNFETAPFFLECEYGGDNLADWAAAGHLARMAGPERLALFLRIADAVAAAHSIGVLHKDLKPANVLITTGNDDWVVRLTDFGSGRLLEPGRLQELGITQLGFTVTQNLISDSSSGTPLYIAPEVIGGSSPTVQTDLYSLSVMLYQMIIGDLKKPMAPGWEQDIPDALLREDIAAATDGNPQRRLAGVTELIERLRTREARKSEREQRRAVEERAVAAERALDRTRARRPWLIGVVATLAVGLAVGLGLYGRTLKSERALAQQYGVIHAVNKFLTQDMIGAANPSVNGRGDVTVAEAAKAAAPQVDQTFADSPEIRATLHHALQESLSGLAEIEPSVGEGRKAMAAYGEVSEPDIVGYTETRALLAYELARTGHYQEATEILDRLEKDMPGIGARHPELQIRFWEGRSQVKEEQLDIKGAVEFDRKSWALMQTLPDAPPHFRDRIEFNLADSLAMLGELDESQALLRDLIARQTAHWGAEHWKVLYSSVVLANDLLLQRRYDEAEPLAAKAASGLTATLGPNHRRTLMANSVLARIDLLQGKFDQAATVYTRVHDGLVAQYGETNPTAIVMLGNLAVAIQHRGDPQAAEAVYRKAMSEAGTLFKNDNPQIESLRYGLADCLIELGRTDEAEQLLKGLDPAILNVASQTPDWRGRLDYQAGRIALARGDAATALPLLETAVKEISGAHGPDWDQVLVKATKLLETARSQVGRSAATAQSSD